VAFDDYYVYDNSGSRLPWMGTAEPIVVSGQMDELEKMLPEDNR
jgi:hypothetical protein